MQIFCGQYVISGKYYELKVGSPIASAFMLNPVAGDGICRECFNMTRGFDRCFACSAAPPALDAVVPISYSVADGPLHRALAGYKRRHDGLSAYLQEELAAVLSQFLELHEPCIANRVGVDRFTTVTTVPSGNRLRDECHPLHWVVGEFTDATGERHERLLRRTSVASERRTVDPARYEAVRSLDGEAVLLIDDTWTTGASVRSAALALRRAGAGPVAAVVIGRFLNRGWDRNDIRLRTLRMRPFDWDRCVLCADGHAHVGPHDRAFGPNSAERAVNQMGAPIRGPHR